MRTDLIEQARDQIARDPDYVNRRLDGPGGTVDALHRDLCRDPLPRLVMDEDDAGEEMPEPFDNPI